MVHQDVPTVITCTKRLEVPLYYVSNQGKVKYTSAIKLYQVSHPFITGDSYRL